MGIQGNLPGISWTAPTLEAGWANVQGGWIVARYGQFGGIVVMSGLIQNTSGATKPAGSTMFILPAGLRPIGALVDTPFGFAVQVTVDGRVANNGDIADGGVLSLNLSFGLG